MNESTSDQEQELKRLRAGIQQSEERVMEQFRRILNDTSFELSPLCVYVIMDKLRGIHNSAGIPDKSYKKAEQMLKVLGVDKYWKGQA